MAASTSPSIGRLAIGGFVLLLVGGAVVQFTVGLFEGLASSSAVDPGLAAFVAIALGLVVVLYILGFGDSR